MMEQLMDWQDTLFKGLHKTTHLQLHERSSARYTIVKFSTNKKYKRMNFSSNFNTINE